MSIYGRRVCAGCGYDLDRCEFSRKQWAKGGGRSRCALCIDEGITSCDDTTARRNNATRALIEGMDAPFAEGAFRFVARGEYSEGYRAGQAMFVKWFKTGPVFEGEFYASELEVVDKALDILSQWNGAGFIRDTIRLNKPEIWTMDDSGQRVLAEPFIENYRKFNSNTGWVNPEESGWNEVLQAVSHYSYHVSGGPFVLCDLQGGIYRDGAVCTDPVILSRSRRFGPTDLGPEGIASFFARHRCSSYCRPQWTRPRDQTPYLQAQASTSMMASGARAPAKRQFDMAPPPPRPLTYRPDLPPMSEGLYDSEDY